MPGLHAELQLACQAIDSRPLFAMFEATQSVASLV